MPLTSIDETPAILAADANWGLGQVQAYRLLDKLVPKAKALGSRGRHAPELRAHRPARASTPSSRPKKKMALFAAVNSHGSGRRVAPPGGTEGRISTNPICMGAPTSGDPVVIDFGTSAAAEGKVRAQFQKKQPCPDGWLIDHTGQPTTDPGVLYNEPRGNLVPFGGTQAYKGFGLGLLLDLLCGGLSGGSCSNPAFPLAGQSATRPCSSCSTRHSSAAPITSSRKPTALRPTSARAPPRPGCPRSRFPATQNGTQRRSRLVEGIPVPDGTWELIAKTARDLNVPLPA